MAALPAQANQGGGGGGGGKADERATGTGSVATGLRAMYDKKFRNGTLLDFLSKYDVRFWTVSEMLK
jgi:hypothetical protein